MFYLRSNKNLLFRTFSTFKTTIKKNIKERKNIGIPQEILNLDQVNDLIKILKNPKQNEKKPFYYSQFINNIVPGVDETSYVKANFLYNICENKDYSPFISKTDAINILGTMQGGYSVEALIKLLENEHLGKYAYKQLSNTILIFDYFYEVEKLSKNGNKYAKELLLSWANADWFLNKEKVPEKITLSVFKVPGEINTDDLSPAQDAWSRPDIPLHALSMLKVPREGIIPEKEFETGPLKQIHDIKKLSNQVAFVGDVVGTGSSRKSATNSILWYFGEDIPNVPNKKIGGVCIGDKIAPIFFNTMEDSGALPIEMPVENIDMGDIIDIYPYLGKTEKKGETICNWELKSDTILDSVRAGGRINLIIGKNLTNKAQNSINKIKDNIFIKNKLNDEKSIGYKVGYTLAQKMVGKACGVEGILPNNYCEPTVTSVGSQDTTGPMTRDELKDLACLGFSADLVMQSFCHTSAYPKPVDVVTHHSLPDFITRYSRYWWSFTYTISYRYFFSSRIWISSICCSNRNNAVRYARICISSF